MLCVKGIAAPEHRHGTLALWANLPLWQTFLPFRHTGALCGRALTEWRLSDFASNLYCTALLPHRISPQTAVSTASATFGHIGTILAYTPGLYSYPVIRYVKKRALDPHKPALFAAYPALFAAWIDV